MDLLQVLKNAIAGVIEDESEPLLMQCPYFDKGFQAWIRSEY